MDFVRQLAGTLAGVTGHHGLKSTGDLPSPHSDDLQDSQADQITHHKRALPQRQQQQQTSGEIAIDLDSEDPGPDSNHITTQQQIAAAAARLRKPQPSTTAAPADVMVIDDSEEGSSEEGGSEEGSSEEIDEIEDPSSSSDGEDAPSTSGQHQQQDGRVTRHPTQPQRRQQQQHDRQSQDGSASGSESDSDESSSGSDTSSSDSDADERPTGRTGRRASQPTRASAAAAQGTSSRKSSRTAQPGGTPAAAGGRKGSAAQSKGKASTAAVAAAGTPRKGRQQPAAAAATPSRPVRSCTQTPQRSTRSAAAGAQSNPSLATPLGKLSLGSPASAAGAPGSAARVTRSSNRPAAPEPRKAAAPAATPSKQQRQQGAAAAAATTPKPKGGNNKGGSSKVVPLKQVVVEDEVILPGDDLYLMLDDYQEPDSDEEEEEDTCEVCSSSRCSRANAMLECASCLRGFHMRCLKPALKEVPEGDWLCPGCNAGEPPAPPTRLVSSWQKMLYGKEEVAMVHVLRVQRGKGPEGEEEDQMVVRYYILPQDTHLGRQPHHAAREVFLGTQDFVEPTCAVMGKAYVHTPAEFAAAPESEGNDVFVCDYEYDEAWKRFRKRRYDDAAADDVGTNTAYPQTPAGLRLTPSKGKGAAAAAAGGGRRLFADGSDSDSGSEYGGGSDDDADDNYRPDPHHLSDRGKGSVLSKRKRHGQLPGAASDKFVGLGAADTEHGRGELKDSFAKLHASLSLGSVPDSLPCREEERKRLGGFLGRAMHEDGGVLYICGVPGTGKTALVMEMLRTLRPLALKAGAQVVAINCLQLPTPQHVFSRLWEKLSGQHLGPARACEALMQSFGISGSGASRRRHYSTIIVLDEIDMLMTRDQAVLYQIFDWPNQPGTRLAVIGISNTHDLDQRVLPRIASRLDQAKLAFAPYSLNQLETIVNQRLQESGVAGAVQEMAVRVTSRKVATETGDVRRALELLRRAVEIGRAEHLRSTAEARHKAAAAAKQPQPQDSDVVVEWSEGSGPLVRTQHVTQAAQEMFSALHLQLLRSRSQWEKVLLVAVVVEARATGRSAVVMQSVVERASSSICALVNLVPPPLGVLQHCLVKLASVRLLLSDGCHIKAQVALNVDKDDVAVAIKEDERLTSLHQLI